MRQLEECQLGCSWNLLSLSPRSTTRPRSHSASRVILPVQLLGRRSRHARRAACALTCGSLIDEYDEGEDGFSSDDAAPVSDEETETLVRSHDRRLGWPWILESSERGQRK